MGNPPVHPDRHRPACCTSIPIILVRPASPSSAGLITGSGAGPDRKDLQPRFGPRCFPLSGGGAPDEADRPRRWPPRSHVPLSPLRVRYTAGGLRVARGQVPGVCRRRHQTDAGCEHSVPASTSAAPVQPPTRSRAALARTITASGMRSIPARTVICRRVRRSTVGVRSPSPVRGTTRRPSGIPAAISITTGLRGSVDGVSRGGPLAVREIRPGFSGASGPWLPVTASVPGARLRRDGSPRADRASQPGRDADSGLPAPPGDGRRAGRFGRGGIMSTPAAAPHHAGQSAAPTSLANGTFSVQVGCPVGVTGGRGPCAS